MIEMKIPRDLMNKQAFHAHRNELRKVIRLFGSQTDLADMINYHIEDYKLDVTKVCQQKISNWLVRDKKIPLVYTHIIEVLTKGQHKAISLMTDKQRLRFLREMKQRGIGSVKATAKLVYFPAPSA